METRRLLLFTVLTVSLILLWQSALPWIDKRFNLGLIPAPPVAATPAEPSTRSTVTFATSRDAAPVATQPTGVAVGERAAKIEETVLGSPLPRDKQFALGAKLTNVGAAIQELYVNDFRRQLRGDESYLFEASDSRYAGRAAALATRWVKLDGRQVDLADVPWAVEKVERFEGQGERAVYVAHLDADGRPALQVVKTITLYPRSTGADDLRGGYELRVSHALRNLTDRPLTASLAFNGVQPPRGETEAAYDRYLIYGTDRRDGQVVSHNYGVGSLTTVEPAFDWGDYYEGEPFLWLASTSTYYTAIVRPEPREGAGTRRPEWVAKVRSIALGEGGGTAATETVFETVALTLPPGAGEELRASVYVGPRQRELLRNAYYSAPFLGYDDVLVIATGPCAFCTFAWLVDVLFAILRGFYFVTRDWGLAIVGLVVLVRTLLHPITKRSQLSMMRMGKLGPEVEKLKKKYGDDKDELNKQIMALYRTQGAAPILGCLPMFLQMPIWIALWQALQSTFELRHAPFLYGWTWIDDLSKPDHLVDFSLWGWTPVNLFGILYISGLNLLPLLLMAVFFVQFKLQPKPAAMTPEQEQQQKIMLWMTVLLFPLFLYGSPSGLCIYILTSTTIGIVESKIVRRHFEEAERRAGAVAIVDGETVPLRRKAPAGEAVAEPTGFMAKMMARAEKMRAELERQQQAQAKKKKT